jgi:hypothetical protein
MPQTRRKLLDRVTSLIERSSAVSFDVPVDTGYFNVDHEVVRLILDLLQETAEVMGEIGAYFEDFVDSADVEEIDAQDDTDFLKEIGASISTELASREVADLAFMGRNEVLEIRRELEVAVGEENFWLVAANADAGLGRAARALIPIESAIREYEGLPAMRRRWENLDDSLEIRRQYGMLWRAAVRAGTPDDDQLPADLKKIANRIAILRRLKIYPFLRIDDRLSIRKLQKRILAYLDGVEESGAGSGRRLWDDVVAFFGLLMQINNRQELREHDRQVVLSVYPELSRQATRTDRIPSHVLERLEPLLGRDEELDRVLLRPADHTPRDCLAPLERLKEELLQTDTPTDVRL